MKFCGFELSDVVKCGADRIVSTRNGSVDRSTSIPNWNPFCCVFVFVNASPAGTSSIPNALTAPPTFS